MLATVLALALLSSLSLELFFVVSLIGFLVVTELTAPFAVTPRWRARLKWFVLLGLIGFAYVVVRRILAILPPEVVDVLVPVATDPGLVGRLAAGLVGVA